MWKNRIPKLIIPGLTGIAVVIATAQIKRVKTINMTSEAPKKAVATLEVSETSCDRLAEPVESFAQTNSPAALSPIAKLQPSWLSPRGELRVPSEAEIIATHDRLMRGSFAAKNNLSAIPRADFIPLHPSLSWEQPLTIIPEAEIIASHDRLMKGSFAAKNNLPTAPFHLRPERTKVKVGVEMIPASESSELREAARRSPEFILNATRGGRKPSLDLQPSTSNREAFVPDGLPLMRPRGRSSISASISIGTPSAYGKSWGSASVGLGLQARTRFTNTADGGLGIGFGFGNARETVGLDVGLGVADLLGDTARDGSISVKLHRRLPQDFAVAVGVNNAIRWGETDSGSSVYGVVTKMFRLQENATDPLSRLYVSAGLGSGQFRSESDVEDDVDSLGLFGSVTVRVVPRVNAIAEWTGQDLTLGLSLVPFSNLPLVITPAVTDIAGSAGDGSRFILGIGYGFSF